MSKFETPGMRRKERVLEGRAGRPVTIQIVLIKANMAGLSTDDGRASTPPSITNRIEGGLVVATLKPERDCVVAEVSRPGCDTARIRIRDIPGCQAFIKSLSR